MADGGIYISTEIDDAQAAKQLAQLNKDIQKLENEISKGKAAELPIAEQLRDAQKAAVDTLNEIDRLKAKLAASEKNTSIYGNVDANQFAAELENQTALRAQIAEQEKLLAQQEKTAERLEAEDAKRLEKLQQQTQTLEQQKAAAGELTERVTRLNNVEKLRSGFESVKTSIAGGAKKLIMWGFALRSTFALVRRLRTYLVDAVKTFAESDPETQAHIDALTNSLASLKASWGAAFGPILSTVAPLLQTLIGWLNTAANALAAFFAALGGRSTYKKAVTGLNNIASAAGGAGSAAEEAKKQLMGIDELNVLQDSTSSGGGGGGSSGSDLEYIEEEINNKIVDLANLASAIGLNIKDFFVNWELTPENIFKKIMSGAYVALGGAIGFAIGGVPGALLGAAAGLVLSSTIQAFIFNNDGKLSAKEVLKSLAVCLGSAMGGVIGFTVGGPLGAAIGIVIGAGLTLAAKTLLFGDSEITTASFMRKLIQMLIISVGAGIGFTVGGPLGAAIGLAIGIGLTMNAKSLIFGEGEITATSIFEALIAVLGGVVGGLIGFSVGGPAGAALGFAIGVSLEMLVKSIDFEDVWDKIKQLWADIKVGIAKAKLYIYLHFIKPIEDAFETAVAWLNDNIWIPVKTGFETAVAWINNNVVIPVQTAFTNIQTTIDEKLTAISTGWNTMIDGLKTGWQGFVDFIGNAVSSIVSPFVYAINAIIDTWNSVANSINSFGFTIGSDVFTEAVGIAGKGLHLNVPTLENITWGAKGGILNSATLIGAGEAGKEALIPLERNTGWMKTLAEQLVNYMSEVSLPTLPAVASGVVVPPNSYNSGYGFNQELADKLASFLDSYGATGSTTSEMHTHVYLDKREIGEAVTEFQTQQARGRGR